MKGGRYSMVERFMVARSMLRPYAESPLFEQRRSTPSHRPISPPGTGPSPLPKKSSRGRFNPSIGRPRKCGSYLIVSLEITKGKGCPCSHAAALLPYGNQPQEFPTAPSSRLAVSTSPTSHFPNHKVLVQRPTFVSWCNVQSQ